MVEQRSGILIPRLLPSCCRRNTVEQRAVGVRRGVGQPVRRSVQPERHDEPIITEESGARHRAIRLHSLGMGILCAVRSLLRNDVGSLRGLGGGIPHDPEPHRALGCRVAVLAAGKDTADVLAALFQCLSQGTNRKKRLRCPRKSPSACRRHQKANHYAEQPLAPLRACSSTESFRG